MAIFCLLSMTALSVYFAVWIDTEFDAPYYFALKYFSLPFFIVFMWLIRRFGLSTRDRTTPMPVVVVGAALLTVVFDFFASGYVGFANAFLGHREPSVVSGVIVRKFIAGRGASRWVSVQTTARPGPVDLRVDAREFDVLRVGNRYSRPMHLGSLGIYYRFRW